MPVERLRMRPWLENALNKQLYPGVEWVDEQEKIFRLPWKHASRNGWKIQTDASLFKAWAEHTGKYKTNEKANAKTWKANFRCALNSLPDMEELMERRTTKGNEAFKEYRIVDNVQKKNYSSKRLKARNQRRRRQLLTSRSAQKASQTKKNIAEPDAEEEQSYVNSSRLNVKIESLKVPEGLNTTHLVDHDYTVTRYFDIFNDESCVDCTDEEMQEVFDVPDSEIVKTEKLSPKREDEFSMYEESALDSTNMKTSFSKKDEKIMSDLEVVELIDELSSDCGSPSGSVDAAMEELLDGYTDYPEKQRANSAPGMLETPLDNLTTILCPLQSNVPRSKSSNDLQAMMSITTAQELLQSCFS